MTIIGHGQQYSQSHMSSILKPWICNALICNVIFIFGYISTSTYRDPAEWMNVPVVDEQFHRSLVCHVLEYEDIGRSVQVVVARRVGRGRLDAAETPSVPRSLDDLLHLWGQRSQVI